ncbi:MAG TPA: hypothetical protein VF338_10295 [Leptolinea sp.]
MASRIKQNLVVGCLTVLIALPLVGGFFWFLTIGLDQLPRDQISVTSPIFKILLFSGLILLSEAIPFLIVYIVIRRRSRQLDQIFLPLGFTGSNYMIQGRHYQKRLNEHYIDIYIFRGPTVEIWFSVPVDGAFRCFLTSSIPVSIANGLQKESYRSDNNALKPYVFYPAENTWLPKFLDELTVAEAVNSLMSTGADWAIFKRLELIPGELIFNLYKSRLWNLYPLVPDEISAWIQQLALLAEELQAFDLPKVAATIATERTLSRIKMDKLLTNIVLFFVLDLPCIIVLIITLVFATTGS